MLCRADRRLAVTMSARLINPLAVADFDHHARALIEPEVIGRAHIDDAVGIRETARRFERVAQPAPKLRRAWRTRLKRHGNRVIEQRARIPGVRAERRHAARPMLRLEA